jgi:hypothetical protein
MWNQLLVNCEVNGHLLNESSGVTAKRVRGALKALDRLDDVVDLEKPLEAFALDQLLQRSHLVRISQFDTCVGK